MKCLCAFTAHIGHDVSSSKRDVESRGVRPGVCDRTDTHEPRDSPDGVADVETRVDQPSVDQRASKLSSWAPHDEAPRC